MKPIKLYIENFSCHQYSEIDFSLFNSALIVGKVENSDLYSNGVGKSTIFKAIEYALFNQSDSNLERLIRDDSNSCRAVIDFSISDDIYRISRTRTKKGVSDVSLFIKTSNEGSKEDIYKIDADEKFWKNISGRRSADTEKEINKLIKINFQSFRSTMHFVQNDISGLATTTATKRKAILKEAFQLLMYSKLEKLAKDKYSILSKDIDKSDMELGFLNEEILKLDQLNIELNELNNNLIPIKQNKNKIAEKLNKLNEEKNNITSKLSSFNDTLQNLKKSKSLIETQISSLRLSNDNYTKKKNILSSEAKSIIELNNKLTSQKQSLSETDFSKINILQERNEELTSLITNVNSQLGALDIQLKDLSIPISEGSSCKHCRQPISSEHVAKCKEETDKLVSQIKQKIQELKVNQKSLAQEFSQNKTTINELSEIKTKLSKIETDIASNLKEVEQKKNHYNEYKTLASDVQEKINQLEANVSEIDENIKSSQTKEFIDLNNNLDILTSKIKDDNVLLKTTEEAILGNEKNIAIITSKIQEINKLQEKKKIIEQDIAEKRKNHKTYPYVLQALSSSGISNLIIQSMLDDLQEEVNTLLPQLHPGLQLTFSTEKTKTDGTLDDTLDIIYYLNSKERDFEQLSGAQKLAAVFGLKIGLAFLLKKNLGIELNLLLLDEVDQSLDKAGVDAFADIVKKFEDDFTILVITHNDRLKDKFAYAVLVEQDHDRISKAKVVSDW